MKQGEVRLEGKEVGELEIQLSASVELRDFWRDLDNNAL